MARKKDQSKNKAAKKSRIKPPKQYGALVVPVALGLIASISFVIFDLKVYDQYEFPKTLFLRTALGFLFIICAVDILRRGFPALTVMLKPYAVYITAMVLSVVFSVSPHTSFFGTYESVQGLWAYLTYGAAFLITALWVRNERSGRWLFRFISLGLLFIVIAACMYRAGYDFPTLMGYITSRNDPGRVGATLGNPNFLAAALYMSMPLVAYLALREEQKWLKYLLALLLAFMIMSIFFTGSRTGYIVPALLLPAAYLLYQYYAPNRKLLPVPIYQVATAVAVAGLGLFISKHQLPRFFNSLFAPLDAIGERRIFFWKPALEVFKEYPLFGSGVDTFKITAIHHFQPVVYQTLGGEVAPLRAHNELLNMLATTGIVGTAAWLAMLGFAAYYGLKASKLPDEKGGYLARAALLGLFAIFVGNLLNFGVVSTHLLESIFIGVIAGIYTTGALEKSEGFTAKPVGNKQILAGALLVVSIIFAIFISLDSVNRRDGDREFFKAYLESSRQKFEGAVPHLEEALKKVPTKVKYLFYMSQIKEILAQRATGAKKKPLTKEAFEYYQKVFNIEPVNPSLLSGLGRTYQLMGENDRALELVSKAVETAPGVFRYRRSKLNILQELGKWDEAEKELDKIIADWGAWESFSQNSALELGKAYSRAGKSDDAIRIYKKAIELNPSNPAPYFQIGLNHAKNNRTEEAQTWINKALEKDPAYKPALDIIKILKQ